MTRTADPYDELAGLFLTEPDMPGSSDARAPLELVVVGHLPVRAGLWLAPYADAVARKVGPVVLIRLDDSTPHLQLLRGSTEQLQQVAPGATLRQAIRILSRMV